MWASHNFFAPKLGHLGGLERLSLCIAERAVVLLKEATHEGYLVQNIDRHSDGHVDGG